MREEPDGRCGYKWTANREVGADIQEESCCWRETTQGSDLCVWHAPPDEVDKSADTLRTALKNEGHKKNSPHTTFLDGAKLSGLNLGDSISFSNFALRRSDFSDTDLSHADFSNADLSGADLSDVDLFDSNLKDARLKFANLSDTYLNHANLPRVDLSFADLTGTNCYFTNFTESEFSGATLVDTELHGADLTETDFRGVVFSGVDLREISFKPACDRDPKSEEIASLLEDVQFEDRTDLRGADFSGAKLYQTAFRDVRINDKTSFGIEDGNRGSACRYDYDQRATVTNNDDIDRLEAAAWTYRRLESLFEENAMDQRARNAHIRKEETQRLHAKGGWTDSWLGWFRDRFVPTINYHLHRHGESVSRLLAVSAILIAGCTFVYAGAGIARGDSVVYNLELSELTSPPAIATDLLNSLYFSIITFSTIGYGDFYPASPLSRLLVGIQSLAGALFIALFVFVLGRHVAR